MLPCVACRSFFFRKRHRVRLRKEKQKFRPELRVTHIINRTEEREPGINFICRATVRLKVAATAAHSSRLNGHQDAWPRELLISRRPANNSHTHTHTHTPAILIAARPNPRDPWPVAGPAPTFREGRVFPKFRSVGGRSMALADRPTTHLHTLPPSSSTANIFPKWRQISIKATQSCTSQNLPVVSWLKFHSFQLESNSFE